MAEVQLRSATVDDIGPMSDLIWATGSSYNYMFKGRELFDIFVKEAWVTPGVTFAFTEATVAVRNGKVLGLELGAAGQEWYDARAKMKIVSQCLYESKMVSAEHLKEIGERTYRASYLNPYIPGTAYYVTALSLVDEAKGAGVGKMLLQNAMDRARDNGKRQLQLDVFSDNQAVGFYRAAGLECLAETIAPGLDQYDVPMEMRMAIDL